MRLTYRAGKYHPDCQRFMEQVAIFDARRLGRRALGVDPPRRPVVHLGGRWSTAHDHDAELRELLAGSAEACAAPQRSCFVMTLGCSNLPHAHVLKENALCSTDVATLNAEIRSGVAEYPPSIYSLVDLPDLVTALPAGFYQLHYTPNLSLWALWLAVSALPSAAAVPDPAPVCPTASTSPPR